MDTGAFVPFSARLMAAMRSHETARDDRLFADPFAERLAGAEAFERLDRQITAQDLAYVAVRTRYFDDFVLSACAEIEQLVILASGMDTRAFRLPFSPKTIIYEFDRPEVLSYKMSALRDVAPQCQHRAIAADLTQDWETQLLANGFQPHRRSVWLVEGLLMYLSESNVVDLMTKISSLTPFQSRIGLDTVNVKGIDYAPYKGYFQFGIDRPQEYFAQYGWKVTARQPGEKETHFNRYSEPPSPKPTEEVARVFLVTGEKS